MKQKFRHDFKQLHEVQKKTYNQIIIINDVS